jgi:cyclase
LDVRSNNGNYQIFCDNGQSLLKDSLIEVLHSSTTDVYGEILLTSIDHDGRSIGYDIDLLRTVSTLALQPIIAMGGVGDVSHFQQAIENGIPAVAAANIFHFLGRRLSIFRDSLIEVDPQHRTRLWKFQEGHPL